MPKEDRSSDRSFDDLARALAEGSISRRRALKLFVGSALAALIPSRALAQPKKVAICHKPGTPEEKTMEVPKSAVASHLGHGDRLGPCGTTTTTSTSTSTSSTTSTSTTTPMCLPNGGTCTADTQCCSGICDSRFGICRLCRSEGNSCTANNNQCCTGNCENGFCCTTTIGGDCTIDTDCCGNLICHNRLCSL